MVVKQPRRVLAAPLPKRTSEVTEVVNFTCCASQSVIVSKFQTLSCVHQELMVLRPACVPLASGTGSHLHYLREIIVRRSCLTESLPMQQSWQRWLSRKAAALKQRCSRLWPFHHSCVQVHAAKHSPNLRPNVEPPLSVVAVPDVRNVKRDLLKDLFVRRDMDCLRHGQHVSPPLR